MGEGAVLVSVKNEANHEGHVGDIGCVHQQVDDYLFSTHPCVLHVETEPRVEHYEE